MVIWYDNNFFNEFRNWRSNKLLIFVCAVQISSGNNIFPKAPHVSCKKIRENNLTWKKNSLKYPWIQTWSFLLSLFLIWSLSQTKYVQHQQQYFVRNFSCPISSVWHGAFMSCACSCSHTPSTVWKSSCKALSSNAIFFLCSSPQQRKGGPTRLTLPSKSTVRLHWGLHCCTQK